MTISSPKRLRPGSYNFLGRWHWDSFHLGTLPVRGDSDEGQERALAVPCVPMSEPFSWVVSSPGLSQLRVKPPGTPLATSICPTGVQTPMETKLLWQVFTTL